MRNLTAGPLRRLVARPPAWTSVGLLVTAALFRSAQNTGQTTFPLLAKDRLGADAGAVGALGTASGAVMVVAAVVLAAKLPTRAASSAVAAGAAVLAAGLLVVGSTTSMVQMAAGMVLLGVAGGVTPPSLATAIGASAGEHREKQLAHYSTVLSASLAAGPLAETAILYLAHQDVRIPFFAFAPLPVLALGLGLPRSREPVVEQPRPSGGHEASMALDVADAPLLAASPPGAVPEPAGPGSAAGPEARPGRPGRTVLLGTAGGRVALIMQLLYGVPFATVTVFGALIARSEFGLNAAHSQLGFTTFFATSLLSRVVVARRSPVRAKLAVFAVCIALTVAGLALLASGGPAGVYFVAMALLGVPHGVIFPLALALVASSSRHEQLGAANAGMFAAISMVSAVTPAILGALAAASGYRVMTVCVLAPVAAFSVLLVTQRRAAALG